MPAAESHVLLLVFGTELFGQERANLEVAIALRECGCRVTVGVNGRFGDTEVSQHVADLGFDTIRLPFGYHWSLQFAKRHPWLPFANLWAIVACSWRVGRAIRGAAVTHIQIGNALAYSYIWPALALSAARLIWRVGDLPSRRASFGRFIWKRCAHRADQIVCNAEFVRRALVERLALSPSGEGIAVIYNRSRLSILSQPALVSNGESCRLLYVGQLAPHKGVALLIEAMASAWPSGASARLDVVGGSLHDREYRDSLQARCAELGLSGRVHFHGRCRDLDRWYQGATALVVPTLTDEPAANVVLEAKSQGLPAIVFPSGGLPELLTPGETGWICEARTEDALAEVLRRVIADQGKLEAMRQHCLDEAAERFSPSVFRERWCAKITFE